MHIMWGYQSNCARVIHF
uniref:Uncharacterized protein n=1 Tax=Anguilla anguilla TaxID=7936 RepID=A0A0E9PUF4_ANGAN